jgi:glycerophosphoryl diester phosphodiesterase
LSQSRQAELQRLIAQPFAHRGLHGSAIIENSRAAFRAAIEKGHGIELDVQASRDGEAMVIHDADLQRLAGRSGEIGKMTVAALAEIRLTGCDEGIAPLHEVLELIGSRVPLLIEVKAPGRHVGRLCLAVFRALAGYRGAVGVMSFNPEVGRWFARNAPRVLRGLVVSEQGKKGFKGRIERELAGWRASPDFLAYDIRDLPSRFAARHRRSGRPLLTWTVRSGEQQARAAAHADQIIYEVAAAA